MSSNLDILMFDNVETHDAKRTDMAAMVKFSHNSLIESLLFVYP